MRKFTSRQFFLTMLLLPIIVPIIFVLLKNESAAAMLFLSVSFGGVQYLFFATMVMVLLLKKCDIRFMRRLSTIAPLLFVPIQGVGWMLWRMFTGSGDLSGIIPELVMFGIYSLIFGYAYVAISAFLYFISVKCGFIVADSRSHGNGAAG